MASDDSAVVTDLRLLREQQWTMHRALVDRVGETNARLENLTVETRAGFAATNARLDDTNANLESLAAETRAGFAEVVARSDHRHKAFETFVDLVFGERRYVRSELDGIKTRLDVVERKVG